MFGLDLIVGGVLGIAGHLKTRDFVQRRLRYTSLIENPVFAVAAGVGTTIVAATLVSMIPFIGAGTAVAMGAGVGTGVAIGSARARRGEYPDD
jgi:hypothetical protein